jgi:hypothetical protein
MYQRLERISDGVTFTQAVFNLLRIFHLCWSWQDEDELRWNARQIEQKRMAIRGE